MLYLAGYAANSVVRLLLDVKLSIKGIHEPKKGSSEPEKQPVEAHAASDVVMLAETTQGAARGAKQRPCLPACLVVPVLARRSADDDSLQTAQELCCGLLEPR